MADPDLQCPGREKCPIYLTDPGECRDCAGAPDKPSALLARLIDIDELAATGCNFALADLSAQEWMGRSALRAARAQLAEKARETHEREAR